MGVKPGSQVAIWATNVPAVVHHLLGGHQDRRRAGDGEHRLQDPRGRVPAAPVRHAHAGHDRRLHRTPTMPRSSTSCAPSSPRPSPASSCTASACRFCATSSPSASSSPAASPGRRPWSAGEPVPRGGGPAHGRRRAPRRRVQHAVHLRHHRLPQGRHAHPLQRGQQRQVHRRPHGPVHR